MPGPVKLPQPPGLPERPDPSKGPAEALRVLKGAAKRAKEGLREAAAELGGLGRELKG